MGASINNLRSFIQWHAERRAFGWRFVWKYIAMPPLGAALAALVYGILQSGMAAFGGGATGANASSITSVSAWATGTLAGYGAHKVFVWLDEKVNSLFKVEQKRVAVPDVIGKTREEAKQIVTDAQLTIGDITEEPTTDPQKVGKVIGQNPGAGTAIECNSEVILIVGKPSEVEALDVPRPDLVGKNGEDASKIAENGKLSPAGEAAKAATGDGQKLATDTVEAGEAAAAALTSSTIGDEEPTQGDQSSTSKTDGDL